MFWVDLLIIGVVAWFTLRAFSNGLIREVVGLLALVLGVVVAGMFYRELAADTTFLVEDPTLRSLAAFAALFLGVLVIGHILAGTLRRVASLLMLGPLDRAGGAAFGFVKALVLVQVALIAIAVFPPADGVAEAVERSALAAFFLDDVPVVELALPTEFDNALQQLRAWQAAGVAATQQIREGS